MKNLSIIILIAFIGTGIYCNTINLPPGSGNPDTVNPNVVSRSIDTCYGFCRKWGPGFECKLDTTRRPYCEEICGDGLVVGDETCDFGSPETAAAWTDNGCTLPG